MAKFSGVDQASLDRGELRIAKINIIHLIRNQNVPDELLDLSDIPEITD